MASSHLSLDESEVPVPKGKKFDPQQKLNFADLIQFYEQYIETQVPEPCLTHFHENFTLEQLVLLQEKLNQVVSAIKAVSQVYPSFSFSEFRKQVIPALNIPKEDKQERERARHKIHGYFTHLKEFVTLLQQGQGLAFIISEVPDENNFNFLFSLIRAKVVHAIGFEVNLPAPMLDQIISVIANLRLVKFKNTFSEQQAEALYQSYSGLSEVELKERDIEFSVKDLSRALEQKFAKLRLDKRWNDLVLRGSDYDHDRREIWREMKQYFEGYGTYTYLQFHTKKYLPAEIEYLGNDFSIRRSQIETLILGDDDKPDFTDPTWVEFFPKLFRPGGPVRQLIIRSEAIISDKVMEAILTSLTNHSLQALEIHHPLNAKAVRQLVVLLQTNPHLESLTLEDCELDREDARLLLETVFSERSTLREFRFISSLKGIYHPPMSLDVFAGLARNKTLENVEIEGQNWVRTFVYRSLAEGLRGNRTLQRLKLNDYSGMQSEEINAWVSALSDHPALNYLSVRMHKTLWGGLARALCRNQSITSLFLYEIDQTAPQPNWVTALTHRNKQRQFYEQAIVLFQATRQDCQLISLVSPFILEFLSVMYEPYHEPHIFSFFQRKCHEAPEQKQACGARLG